MVRMRYFALATDFDGTLAHDSRVDAPTVEALKRLRKSGRIPILVTGRLLDDLRSVFPHLDLFELVVAENGALLYRPATGESTPLAPEPDARFVEALRTHGVRPLDVGSVIVSTWEPHDTAVLRTIRDLGLELQVIFNKGAVMVLPSGVNKASGLQAALAELKLSTHNVVGIGDAENDHAFLQVCECAVAVANALPALKERADLVTAADHGAGVVELIDALLDSDLAGLHDRLPRHDLLLGKAGEREIRIAPYPGGLLLAGSSGTGKSTLTTAFMERLIEHGYQFCAIDPEGDYEQFDGAVVIGDPERPPTVDEIAELLARPNENVIVNLLAVPVDDRASLFERLAPRIAEWRARAGRPHWLIADEAHHLFPADWHPTALELPQEPFATMLITTRPRLIAPAALREVETVVAVGETAADTIREACEVLGERVPSPADGKVAPERGEALLWTRKDGALVRFAVAASKTERQRHRRKYAVGELAEEKSFYFRGPEAKLNLRARNFREFTQLANGVDEETWRYHLERHDYSRWFREMIGDDELAGEAERIESESGLPAAQTRSRILAAVDARYTASA
jgi:hydroxymethylpyrimidine pyrophosphatase-like HAD family hydrolase